MNSFFVTGTDTGVGKTIASRAIMQALQQAKIQIVGYKPIAYSEDESLYTEVKPQESDYGKENNHDVIVLMNTTHEKVDYRDINSYTFDQNFTPILASEESLRIKIEKIDQNLQHLTDKFDTVLVEGTFGWMTPLNKEVTFADWVCKHKMPVVLVVGIKEGCINHALLTIKTITQMGVPLLGWIANRINPGLAYYAKIIEVLNQHINAPLLGEIPYIHHPEKQELGRFITNLDSLTKIQHI